jgi:hypothetical protein
MLPRDELQRFFDGLRDLFGRFDLVAGDVDHAHENVLALEKLEQLHWHMGVDEFEGNLLDAALGERRKDLLVLAPFAA